MKFNPSVAQRMFIGSFVLAATLYAESSVSACGNEAHASSSGASSSEKPSLAVSQEGAQKALLKVKGMSCGSCEKAISAQLKKIDGVVAVSFRKGKDSEGVRVAEVSYSPGAKVAPAALIQAVEKAGYHATEAQ